jgi:hypothetical protein
MFSAGAVVASVRASGSDHRSAVTNRAASCGEVELRISSLSSLSSFAFAGASRANAAARSIWLMIGKNAL